MLLAPGSDAVVKLLAYPVGDVLRALDPGAPIADQHDTGVIRDDDLFALVRYTAESGGVMFVLEYSIRRRSRANVDH